MKKLKDASPKVTTGLNNAHYVFQEQAHKLARLGVNLLMSLRNSSETAVKSTVKDWQYRAGGYKCHAPRYLHGHLFKLCKGVYNKLCRILSAQRYRASGYRCRDKSDKRCLPFIWACRRYHWRMSIR